MKKISICLISLMMICMTVVGVSAQTPNLDIYNRIVDELNEEYKSNFRLYDAETFKTSQQDGTYNEYIVRILNTNLETFKQQVIDVISYEEVIDVNLNHTARSYYGTKKTYFYQNRNEMTLDYKFTADYFDTSYIPTAKVRALNTVSFFIMRSYSGMFLNSNRTYSVLAKGDLYAGVGAKPNASFTVNFNA